MSKAMSEGTPWVPEFQKTLDNHGSKIDMWFLRDDETGETIISVGVPHGDQDTPYKISRAVNSHASLIRALEEARALRAAVDQLVLQKNGDEFAATGNFAAVIKAGLSFDAAYLAALQHKEPGNV